MWYKFSLIALLFFGIESQVFASDAGAGNIWYTFEGDSVNPYLYRVSVAIYNDNGQGSYFTPNRSICLSSSCFPDQSFSLPFVGVFNSMLPVDTIPGNYAGAIITPFLTECIDTNLANNFAETEIHFFSALITLPGKCHDFRFSSRTISRRNYDNIMPSYGLFIYTELNNTFAPNSSPIFVNPAAKVFCVGHNFTWSLGATDIDGDSLLYELSPAEDGNNCRISTDIAFNAGYSVSQPFSTQSGVGFNASNGYMSFQATQLEIVAFNVKVSEYRLINGMWTRVGISERGLQLSFVQGCNQNLVYGPSFDTTANPFHLIHKDSILSYGPRGVFVRDSVISPNLSNTYMKKAPVIQYDCFDPGLTIKFEGGIWCESISKDGSDFRIIGPDSTLIPLSGVRFNCGVDGYVKEFDLLLHKPIDINGDYILQIKPGSDGNTLIGRCGFQMPVFSTAMVLVTNCPVPDYNLINVSVVKDEYITLSWRADSSLYNKKYFNSWQIFRSKGGLNSFSQIGNITEDSVRVYTDSALNEYWVDKQSFDYQIRMSQNFNLRPPSKVVNSILLQAEVKDTNRPNEIDFVWNDYFGWPNPSFELFIGRKTLLNQSVNWVSIEGPASNFLNHTYDFPETTLSNERTIFVKVVATNPHDILNNFESESNWVMIDFVYEPPEPDKMPIVRFIPNVFTPNGDGINDFFAIDADYQTIHLTVYNRWGTPVYDYQGVTSELLWDGKGKTNGQLLADGVYFYVAKFSSNLDDGLGNFTEVSENQKGNITLITGD